MKALVALGWALALAGCAVGPDYTRPRLPVTPAFRAAPATPPPAGDWWAMFHDPALDALEAKALAGNLSIEAALARLDQARAAARGAVAARLPAGQADANAARAEQSQNAGLGQLSRYAPLLSRLTGQPDSGGLARSVGNYQLDAGASWDLDFAGGLARRAQAAHADAQAAAAGVAAARLAVSADLADAYLAYRGAAGQAAALADADADAKARLAIMAARVRLGGAAASALDQARADAATVAAALPLVAALREAEANRIAVLTGQSPSLRVVELVADAPVPVADGFGAGAPADLLRDRPDLAIAEDRLVAANARIGASLAEYYPHVTLSALLGFNSASLGNLLTGGSFLAQGGGALRWRLFDFGRVDAEVKAARGATREALADYRAAVLGASEEVESGFARAQAAATHADALATRRDALRAAAAKANTAFAHGAISRDADTAARAALAASQADLAAARADAGRAAIAARRALGH